MDDAAIIKFSAIVYPHFLVSFSIVSMKQKKLTGLHKIYQTLSITAVLQSEHCSNWWWCATLRSHMLKVREQLEVREEIMYDRGLVRSKPCLDRDEPFPAQCRLFIWQMAATSFLRSSAQLPQPQPSKSVWLIQSPSGNRIRLQRKTSVRSGTVML